MVKALAFKSDLKATAAHSKMHGVHVNLTRVGLVNSWRTHVCELVLKQRNEDLDFLASSFSDGLHQALKPRMRILSAVDYELGLGVKISLL